MRSAYFCLIAILIIWGTVYAQSSNPDLEVLQVRATGGAKLVPAFSKERTEYEVKVNSDIGRIQIRAAAWVRASKIKVNNHMMSSLAWYRGALKTGTNRFVVNILAPDGKTTKDYTIEVHREDIKPVADAFLKFVHIDPATGLSMPYRLFVPANYDPSKKYPLVMFLHGGGEAGDDNAKQLYSTEGPTIWAKPEEQAKRPAFVLAPQANPTSFSDAKLQHKGFKVTRNSSGERYMDQPLIPYVMLLRCRYWSGFNGSTAASTASGCT